jgi:hypothetical protein
MDVEVLGVQWKTLHLFSASLRRLIMRFVKAWADIADTDCIVGAYNLFRDLVVGSFYMVNCLNRFST